MDRRTDALLAEPWEQPVASHSLKVHDPDYLVVTTKHSFELVAIRPARFFRRWYRWTGAGVEKDPTILTGKQDSGVQKHRLHGPVLRDGTDRWFLVDLGRDLATGETDTVAFEHFFVNTVRAFSHRLGHTTRVHTKSLTLEVELPFSDGVTMLLQETEDGASEARDQQTIQPEPIVGQPAACRVGVHGVS